MEFSSYSDQILVSQNPTFSTKFSSFCFRESKDLKIFIVNNCNFDETINICREIIKTYLFDSNEITNFIYCYSISELIDSCKFANIFCKKLIDLGLENEIKIKNDIASLLNNKFYEIKYLIKELKELEHKNIEIPPNLKGSYDELYKINNYNFNFDIRLKIDLIEIIKLVEFLLSCINILKKNYFFEEFEIPLCKYFINQEIDFIKSIKKTGTINIFVNKNIYNKIIKIYPKSFFDKTNFCIDILIDEDINDGEFGIRI